MGGLDFQFGMHWEYGEKKGEFVLVHRSFIDGINDWSPGLTLVADDVLEPYVIGGFRSEGRSEGVTWKDLAPSTVRARHGSAHPILQFPGSGHLMHSFEKGGEDHVEDITPRKLVWGSNVPYALFHQFGTSGKVNFRAAGARKVITKTTKAARELAKSQGRVGGLVPRPMIVYSKFLADDITSKMRSYALLIARKVGYRVASRPGEEPVSPLEARKIGQQILGA